MVHREQIERFPWYENACVSGTFVIFLGQREPSSKTWPSRIPFVRCDMVLRHARVKTASHVVTVESQASIIWLREDISWANSATFDMVLQNLIFVVGFPAGERRVFHCIRDEKFERGSTQAGHDMPFHRNFEDCADGDHEYIINRKCCTGGRVTFCISESIETL